MESENNFDIIHCLLSAIFSCVDSCLNSCCPNSDVNDINDVNDAANAVIYYFQSYLTDSFHHPIISDLVNLSLHFCQLSFRRIWKSLKQCSKLLWTTQKVYLNHTFKRSTMPRKSGIRPTLTFITACF